MSNWQPSNDVINTIFILEKQKRKVKKKTFSKTAFLNGTTFFLHNLSAHIDMTKVRRTFFCLHHKTKPLIFKFILVGMCSFFFFSLSVVALQVFFCLFHYRKLEQKVASCRKWKQELGKKSAMTDKKIMQCWQFFCLTLMNENKLNF